MASVGGSPWSAASRASGRPGWPWPWPTTRRAGATVAWGAAHDGDGAPPFRPWVPCPPRRPRVADRPHGLRTGRPRRWSSPGVFARWGWLATVPDVRNGRAGRDTAVAGFVQIIEFRTSRIDEFESLIDEIRSQLGPMPVVRATTSSSSSGTSRQWRTRTSRRRARWLSGWRRCVMGPPSSTTLTFAAPIRGES